MEITEVHLTLVDKPRDRLRAFCSITFDDAFVVKDLKVIEGRSGLFVAMPSRKRTSRCTRCNAKNPIQAAYCSQCGHPFQGVSIDFGEEDPPKYYAEIVHPITASCRQAIESRVIRTYQEELRHPEPTESAVSGRARIESLDVPGGRSAVSASAGAEPLRGPHRLSDWRGESEGIRGPKSAGASDAG